MKKRSMKRLLASGLAVVLALSLGACGSGENSSATDPAETTKAAGAADTTKAADADTTNAASSGELTTITLYPAAGNISSGMIGGYKGRYFASLGFQ